jgi:ubiquinone/menaquinone biosynthesis C-methylase UbiE
MKTMPPLLAAVALLSTGLAGGCASLKRFAYEGFGRDRWQQPDRVVESLGIERGQSVADLGAGGGYFTFRLADAVGPQGTVYAVDIDEGMLGHLRERASKEGYGNVEPVSARPDDPLLPEAGVDLIFTCNTYHHIESRAEYFARAKRYLRAEGRVAIVEPKRRGWLSALFPHYTERDRIETEMKAAGYRLERKHGFLSRQSFLVFAVESR